MARCCVRAACCILPRPPPSSPAPRDPQQRKGTPLGFLFVCFVGANDAGAASGGHLTFGRFASCSRNQLIHGRMVSIIAVSSVTWTPQCSVSLEKIHAHEQRAHDSCADGFLELATDEGDACTRRSSQESLPNNIVTCIVTLVHNRHFEL